MDFLNISSDPTIHAITPMLHISSTPIHPIVDISGNSHAYIGHVGIGMETSPHTQVQIDASHGGTYNGQYQFNAGMVQVGAHF